MLAKLKNSKKYKFTTYLFFVMSCSVKLIFLVSGIIVKLKVSASTDFDLNLSPDSKQAFTFLNRLEQHTIIFIKNQPDKEILVNSFPIELNFNLRFNYPVPGISYCCNISLITAPINMEHVKLSKFKSVLWTVFLWNSFGSVMESIAYLPIQKSRDLLLLIDLPIELQFMKLKFKYIFLISKKSIYQYQELSKEIPQKWLLIDNPEEYKVQKHKNNFHKTCLLLTGQPFDSYKNTKMQDRDKRLSEIKSIIFYHYSKKFDGGLSVITETVINPLELIAKYLIEKLNLSASACADNYYKDILTSDQFDLQQGISNSKIQKRINKMSRLIDTGDTLEIKFIAPQKILGNPNFHRILGPLDLSIILLVFTIAIIIILTLKIILTKTTRKEIKTTVLISIISRPLLDQCQEDRLPSSKVWFRLILSTWLICCLVISETYRGVLVTFLMKRAESTWINTFEQLGESSEIDLTVFNTSPENLRNIRQMLQSQFQKSTTNQKTRGAYQNILNKLSTIENQSISVSFIDNFVKGLTEGSIAVFSNCKQLESFCKAMEISYWGSFYQISKDSMQSPKLLAIAYGPLEEDVSNSIIWMRDCGILDVLRKHAGIIDEVMIRKQIRQGIFKHPLITRGNLSDRKWHFENIIGPRTLKLRHVLPVILILLIGICISLLASIGEFIYYRVGLECLHYGDSNCGQKLRLL